MPIGDEGGGVVVLLAGFGLGRAGGGREERWEREEVAGAGRPGGDEGEDLGEETLLYRGVLCMYQLLFEWTFRCVEYELGVKLGQAWLAIVVEDQYCVDHVGRECAGLTPLCQR